jgi:putative DNA primase/helicase
MCPAHDDRNPSLTFRYRNGRLLVRCWAGCLLEQVLGAVGWHPRDLYDTPYVSQRQTIVAEFVDYTDPDGGPLPFPVRKLRLGPRRDFKWQRRESGEWRPGLGGIAVGLFNLDAVRGEPRVLWVEGEGCVRVAVDTFKMPALCSAHGSDSNDAFVGRCIAAVTRVGISELIVWPDNDRPGRRHAEAVLTAAERTGLPVKRLRVPHLPPAGDIADYRDAGHESDDLRRLVAECPPWTAAADREACRHHEREQARLRKRRQRERQRGNSRPPARHAGVSCA